MKISIPIYKSVYTVECSKEEEREIIDIGKVVNQEIIKLSEESNIVDEKTLAILYAIAIRRELENNNGNILQELEENISAITNHVKKITKKIIEKNE